jgi:uncharacterized integral membrane protein
MISAIVSAKTDLTELVMPAQQRMNYHVLLILMIMVVATVLIVQNMQQLQMAVFHLMPVYVLKAMQCTISPA